MQTERQETETLASEYNAANPKRILEQVCKASTQIYRKTLGLLTFLNMLREDLIKEYKL